MGKLIVIEHLTLDGVMQAPARPDEDTRDGFQHGGWAARGAQDPRIQEVLGKHMTERWSLLLGRTTYQDFYAVWPKRAPEPDRRGAQRCPEVRRLNDAQRAAALAEFHAA